MDLQQIRYFLSVCDHKNFTRAAQFSNVSQPSLSQSIKKLEEELGGPLFQRDRGGTELTALGRLVAPRLRRLYDQALLAKSEALRFSDANRKSIRIGISQSIGPGRLSGKFSRFFKDQVNLDAELTIGTPAELQLRFESGDIDLLITSGLAEELHKEERTRLYEERYLALFAPDHRFAEKSEITLEDLKRETYIDRLGCEFRDDLNQVCAQREINLIANWRSSDENWLLAMVRTGAGVAVFPEFAILPQDSLIAQAPFTDPPIVRQVVAIARAGSEVYPSVQDLIKCLKAA